MVTQILEHLIDKEYDDEAQQLLPISSKTYPQGGNKTQKFESCTPIRRWFSFFREKLIPENVIIYILILPLKNIKTVL